MVEIIRNFRMSPSLYHYYNVSVGVGADRKNERLDVLLVQFFLNNIKLPNGQRLVEPRLEQDGIFGPKTRAAILDFQQFWNAQRFGRVPRVETDGVVSPGRGVSFGNGTKTWTILALNIIVGNPPNFGLALYRQLHTHPLCPPELRSFFEQAPAIPVSLPRVPNPVTVRPQTPPPASAIPSVRPSAFVTTAAPTAVGNRLHPSVARSQPLTNRVTEIRASRNYNRSDPGVQWAAWVLRAGPSQFSAFEHSEIMEAMEGTGRYSLNDRTELLLQMIELTTGDGYPQGTTLSDLMEFLRQAEMLGTPSRVEDHPMQNRDRLLRNPGNRGRSDRVR